MGGHPHRILTFWHNQFQTDYFIYKIQIMTVNSAFQKVVALQVGHRHVIPLTPYDLDCIALAHQRLCKDPSPRITIDALALDIGINRNKLNYGFKYVHGVTINEFQEKQRMEKAELLLTTTRKSVKAIACLTHYCTSSRFGVVFKKTYGITPLQYRKKIKTTYHYNDQ
jgi:AraC-like DNA-binding protein